METLKQGEFYSIKRFDREDYLDNFELINGLMTRVFSSHEGYNDFYDYDEALEYINEKNTDFFMEEFLIPKLYVLFDEQNNTPVSFALYSHDKERDDWHLEFISTHKDYSNMGYAEAIFKSSAKDLINTEYPRISSVVAKNNKSSLALHNAIGGTIGIGFVKEEIENNRYSFLFELKNMSKQDAKKVVDDIVF